MGKHRHPPAPLGSFANVAGCLFVTLMCSGGGGEKRSSLQPLNGSTTTITVSVDRLGHCQSRRPKRERLAKLQSFVVVGILKHTLPTMLPHSKKTYMNSKQIQSNPNKSSPPENRHSCLRGCFVQRLIFNPIILLLFSIRQQYFHCFAAQLYMRW